MSFGRTVSIFLFVAFAAIGLTAAGQTAPAEGGLTLQSNVSLRPSTGNAGTTVDVAIRGYFGDPGTLAISFQPAGFLTARNLRLQTRELFFTLDISPNAPARAYTLVLTSTAPAPGTRVPPPPMMVPDAFRVRRPVRVTSVNPAQIAPGTSANVTIAGSGFQSKAKLFFPGTTGVTATVTNVTATSIAATFTADANASPGARPFVVQNPDGSDNADQSPLPSIMVSQPVAAPVPPVVTAITPASAAQGASLLVRIAGSNFQKGATVNLGAGITAQVASVTPAEIIANVAVAASAAPGARRVNVRNPDGLTNDAQPRPVELTITAAVAKPPETKPPATTPPVTTPPATTPPVTTPPVTTPPATTPPATTPPATVPPTTPPATTPTVPPVTRPPVTTPPVTKLPVPPLLPPPRATLPGPRVDAVNPQSLTPGQTYLLNLEGKNFSPETKIALGKDVTVVGVPIVLSPTKARLQVIVSPAAKAGVIPAVASNGKEQNSGPGGVMIAAASGKKNETKVGTPQAPTEAAVKQVFGSIALLKPCTPYENYTCNDVPLLNDSVKFTWKELTPGVAQVFVFEIIDVKQNVLYTAQTQAPYLEWSASKLGSVFDKIATKPHGSAAGSGGVRAGGVRSGGESGSGVALAGSKPGSQQGVPHAQKLSDTEWVLKSYPDSIFWRVRGMRQKSGKQKELYVAEESEIRPLSLPKPPSGFSCPAGSKSKIAIVPVPSAEPYAAPCEKKSGKYSTNICSGMTARFSEDSVVDLTNIPFEFGQLGKIGEGGSMAVGFIGLFVDWGDGSEPQPLVVAGDESPSLAQAKIYTSALKHVYKNKNSSDEKHEYFARIYAISDDSPISLAAVGKAAAKASTSGGAQGNKTVHTVACTTVKVFNEVDTTKDGPLTLVSAMTIFPEDWSKLAAIAQAGVGGGAGDVDAIPIFDLGAAGGGTAHVPPSGSGTATPGSVGTGKTTAAPLGAPPSATSTNVAKIDTSQVTSVSECAEAFRPFVRIRYYGRGRARVRWTLDGKIIDEHETAELPPVTYSDAMAHKKSYDVDLSIPLPAKFGKGMNLHTLKVHVETGALPGSMTSAGAASSGKNSGAAGMTLGDSKHVSSTIPPVTGGGPSLGSGGSSSTSPVGGMTPGGANAPTGKAGIGIFDPGAGTSSAGPFSEVDAAPRAYQVVAQLPGVPCRIIYKTAKSGTITISDITGFTLEQGGSSGSGKLHLVLAGEYGGTTKEYADVTFKNWKLEPRSGEPTHFDAISGSLSGKTYAVSTVRNFPLELTALSLNSEQLLIDGSVSLPPKNISPVLGKMPRWTFSKVLMQPGGQFAFTSKTPGSVALGNSNFTLDIAEIAFDFGFMKAPAGSCNKSSFGGALVTGTLRAPQPVTFGTKPIFSNAKVGPWPITPQGLAVKLDTLPIGTTVSEGAVKITTSDVSANSCDGAFTPKFQLAIAGVPFFTDKITGKGSLDAHGNLLVALDPATSAKSWSNADAQVSSLSLHREDDWFFLANGAFAFTAYGKPFKNVDYEGLRLGFDGSVELPPLPVNEVEKSTTSLAGFPFTITKLTASGKGGTLQFAFTGDIKFAEHAKNAPNRDVTFKLPYNVASVMTAPAVQLADAPSFDEGPVALLAGPVDEGGGGAEPAVQSVDIDLDFPEGSGMVQIKATSTWSSSANGYRFTTDNGSISVLDSVEIKKTRFVFGNDKGESYWLAQASYKLPVPVQLATTPLYLFAIGGGLGHNVAITSFNAPIENIVAAHQPSVYLFSGEVDIGTLDEAALWTNGRLTVKLGDGFAARADVNAWVLDSQHAPPAMATGCMQYAGGAFSAGVGVHYSALDGAIVVDAPAGPDPCQASAVHIYFGGDDWHINVGRPDARVSAKAVGASGAGSLMVSSSGAAFDFVVHYGHEVSLDIGVCTAHAGYTFDWGIGAGFTYKPFNLTASAAAGVGVSAGCGWFDVGAGGEVKLALSLPGTTELCGTLRVYVHVLGKNYNLINTGNFCL
jgi:hypothetical protein